MAAQLAVWTVALLCLGGYTRHQAKSVRQREATGCCRVAPSNIARDIAGCLFTFVSSILVYYEVLTEKFSAYLDPVIALLYIIFLVCSSVSITRDSCLILLQTIPGNHHRNTLVSHPQRASLGNVVFYHPLLAGNVDVSLLKKFLLAKFPGILSLHEFHTWTFTPGTLVITGHITYQASRQ